MIIAPDKYAGYMLTSLPIAMMSSAVAMVIMFIIHNGSILFRKGSRCRKIAIRMSDFDLGRCNLANLADLFGKYLKTVPQLT